MDFATLRVQYPAFLYKGYTVTAEAGALRIVYDFSIPGLCDFHPQWRIPCDAPQDFVNDPTVERMVFSLGMTELISYWKITCSPTVRVLCGSLSDAWCQWWKTLYFGGLGEFFYRNGIDTTMSDFMQIHCEGKPLPDALSNRALSGRLIPVGGGKDSIVTLSLLKDLHADSAAFMINHRDSSVAAAKLAGIPEARIYEVSRTLDKNMLECNAKGFLNGHTPFSAIVAFSAVLTAYLHGLQSVILSNESSACESTVSQAEINHQYSKSYAFEQDFFTYERDFLRSGVQYYSLLRPLTEFQIARYFATLPAAYHRIFRSCNAGAKTDAWCGKCPKCLFVSVILLPFLPYSQIVSLIGNDMLNDAAYLPVLQELCGLLPNKPFECVGSRKEVNIALCLGIARMIEANEALPLLLAAYQQTPLYAQYQTVAAQFGNEFDTAHHLPQDMEQLVRNQCVTAYSI